MAFSDYKTIAQAQEEYNIKYLEADFIEITDLKPNDFSEGWGQCLAELIAVH